MTTASSIISKNPDYRKKASLLSMSWKGVENSAPAPCWGNNAGQKTFRSRATWALPPEIYSETELNAFSQCATNHLHHWWTMPGAQQCFWHIWGVMLSALSLSEQNMWSHCRSEELPLCFLFAPEWLSGYYGIVSHYIWLACFHVSQIFLIPNNPDRLDFTGL